MNCFTLLNLLSFSFFLTPSLSLPLSFSLPFFFSLSLFFILTFSLSYSLPLRLSPFLTSLSLSLSLSTCLQYVYKSFFRFLHFSILPLRRRLTTLLSLFCKLYSKEVKQHSLSHSLSLSLSHTHTLNTHTHFLSHLKVTLSCFFHCSIAFRYLFYVLKKIQFNLNFYAH